MTDEQGTPGTPGGPVVNATTTGAALDALRLLAGTPVHGIDGTRLGELSRDGFQDGRLYMRRGLGGPEIAVPEDAIVRHDESGIYTGLTWRDLDALVPPPTPGSVMGLQDAFATGAEGAHANRFDDDDLPE